MFVTDYHGDDYALSPGNSNRMLELIDSGKMDSISIIPNMGCFEECMAMLRDRWPQWEKKPLISVHINIIDGLKLTALPNDNVFKNSWAGLFAASLCPGQKRRQLKEELKDEIKAQILSVQNALPQELPLRLDSHVHTHMIPLVFDAMMQATKELGLDNRLTFIRNSREPLFVFIKDRKLRPTFPLVNIIKNIILNILAVRVGRKMKKAGLPSTMLWGLIMSGNMDGERVKKLSSPVCKYAAEKDSYLEILCHPGIVPESEIRPEYGPDDLSFVTSPNRNVEYDMLATRTV